MSSVNPLVQRLVEIGGGTLDTSRLAPLFPEEESRESQRALTRSRMAKTGASMSRKLDDWQNALSTRELIAQTSQESTPSRIQETLQRPSKKPRRIPVKEEQDAALLLAESVQSLCSTLFGDRKGQVNKKQVDAFFGKLSDSLGKIFDDNDCNPGDIPVIPVLLNMCNGMFGGSFPTFARLGNEFSYLLADVFRNTLLAKCGQDKAVKGLSFLVKGALGPEDAATWLCFFNFGLAFYEFCKLAGADATPKKGVTVPRRANTNGN